jgi:hypothetical protein
MTIELDKLPALDLVAMKADYENSRIRIPQLAAKYGMTRWTMYVIARQQGWRPRRPQRVDKHDLTQRLMRMLEREVEQLESAMKDQDTDQSAVLGKLAATLDRLIALDKATARTPAKRAESKVMQELRRKVAERLEHFGL